MFACFPPVSSTNYAHTLSYKERASVKIFRLLNIFRVKTWNKTGHSQRAMPRGRVCDWGWVGETAAVAYSGSFLDCSKIKRSHYPLLIANSIQAWPFPGCPWFLDFFHLKNCHYFLPNYFYFYLIGSPTIWNIFLFLFIWNDPSRKQSNQANKVMSGVGKGKHATINTFNVKHRCYRKWLFFVPIYTFWMHKIFS